MLAEMEEQIEQAESDDERELFDGNLHFVEYWRNSIKTTNPNNYGCKE